MTKGLIYTVRVLDIVHNKKQIHPDPKPTYKHCIHIQDGNGNTAKCEYLSSDKEVPREIFEVANYFRQIRCVETHEFGDTIEPYDKDEEQKSYHPFDNAPKPQQHTPRAYKEEEHKSSPSILNISGKSITFATAYAKDILVAEMRNWEQGRVVTTEDINRMMGWADTITVAISDRVEFK